MQRGVYLWQSKCAALINLFFLCLDRFSVKGLRDEPTTQHWVPASETQTRPGRVVGLCCWVSRQEQGEGLSYQLLCWVTPCAEQHRVQKTESNLETIRSAGVFLLQYFFSLWDSVTGKPDSNDPKLAPLVPSWTPMVNLRSQSESSPSQHGDFGVLGQEVP